MKSVYVILHNDIEKLSNLNPDLWQDIRHFCNGLTGLDCCQLSDYLEVPDNVSLNDFCTQKFGKEIAGILYKLCTTSARINDKR